MATSVNQSHDQQSQKWQLTDNRWWHLLQLRSFVVSRDVKIVFPQLIIDSLKLIKSLQSNPVSHWITTAMVAWTWQQKNEIARAMLTWSLQSACMSRDKGLPPSHPLTWPTVRSTFSGSQRLSTSQMCMCSSTPLAYNCQQLTDETNPPNNKRKSTRPATLQVLQHGATINE